MKNRATVGSRVNSRTRWLLDIVRRRRKVHTETFMATFTGVELEEGWRKP